MSSIQYLLFPGSRHSVDKLWVHYYLNGEEFDFDLSRGEDFGIGTWSGNVFHNSILLGTITIPDDGHHISVQPEHGNPAYKSWIVNYARTYPETKSKKEWAKRFRMVSVFETAIVWLYLKQDELRLTEETESN